jgi:predicted Zn-dependent peptidase
MASPDDTFLMIPQVQDMIRDARVEILRDQLTAKFRTLPKWADEKLESATPAQVQRWLRKILTAETLTDVLGKR